MGIEGTSSDFELVNKNEKNNSLTEYSLGYLKDNQKQGEQILRNYVLKERESGRDISDLIIRANNLIER